MSSVAPGFSTYFDNTTSAITQSCGAPINSIGLHPFPANTNADVPPNKRGGEVSHRGHLEVFSVVGMQHLDSGRSWQWEIIDSLPPYSTSYLTFENVRSINIVKDDDVDDFPFVVIDRTSQEL